MKQFILVLMMFLKMKSAYAMVIIQSPGSSHEDFDAFLKRQPDAVSYSRYWTEKYQNNPRQEDELYQVGENLETSAQEILIRLHSIETNGPLSVTAINFIYDLSTKLQERSDFKNNADIKVLNCKARSLLGMPLDKCGKVKIDFTAITRQWPFAKTLLIESSSYSLTSLPLTEISSEASYSFTLLSNTHKAVIFKGTYIQFMQQHFAGEPMIEGTCSGFSSNVDDFNIANSGMVFFSNDCLKPINTPPTENRLGDWMEKNKSWVYPVSVLLIGGAGAYALKDKKIVITKP